MLFLFMLCISFPGGAENCDATWEITDIENPSHAGEYDHDNKTVRAENMYHLIHEVKHRICFLTYPEGHERNSCNQNIENKYLQEQIQGVHNE